MKSYSLVFCIATLILLAGLPTANAQNREHQQIMADIRMLQEETSRLQLLMAALDQLLQQLMASVNGHSDITRKAFADQRLLADNIGNDVRILREKLDGTNVRLSSLSQEIEALRIAIPPMPPPVRELLMDPETGLPLETPPATLTRRTAPVSPGVSPQRMYDTAWADYTNGQWALAIQGFEAYLETFARSELADDAQFYVGQTHYADGQFEAAIMAFEQVMLRYPNGDIVPEASYKRGLALDRLGEQERAREAFERVVQNYPDSTMATLAEQALNRLGQPES